MGKMKRAKITLRKLMGTLVLMLFVGTNVHAEIIDYMAFESQRDIIEKKAILVVPIKIVGVNAFNATLFFDYSNTTKYSKPTIGLQIPVDEKNVRTISFESYSLTMYQLNQMANELGIVLDYCEEAIYYKAYEDKKIGLFITGNRSLCSVNNVINLDQLVRTISYREIRD
jgi:hypothetical protein